MEKSDSVSTDESSSKGPLAKVYEAYTQNNSQRHIKRLFDETYEPTNILGLVNRLTLDIWDTRYNYGTGTCQRLRTLNRKLDCSYK